MLAFVIDLAIISVLLEGLALGLYPLTSGYVQSVIGMVLWLDCDRLDYVPEGITLPRNLVNPSLMRDCRQGAFGYTTARTFEAQRQTSQRGAASTLSYRQQLNAAGEPILVPTLDSLLLPLLVLFRHVADRFGGSPGRRLCRIRIADPRTGQHPVAAAVLAKRTAIFAAPLAPLMLWLLLSPLVPRQQESETLQIIVGGSLAIFGALAALTARLAAGAMRRNEDAFYDGAAGTAVLRVDSAQAPIVLRR
jgi:hypothetical protein